MILLNATLSRFDSLPIFSPSTGESQIGDCRINGTRDRFGSGQDWGTYKIRQGNWKMARTWSVPQRGNFASLTADRTRAHALPRALLQASRRDIRRAPLLMVSALLTAIGIAVLNIDSQSLGTILLVAGAGLAGALILCSGETSDASAGQIKAAHKPEAARFTELLAEPQSNAGLDRAAWAKLTAHMSHELRTPLNAVLGFSEMMSKEVFGPLGSSAYGDYARDIHASGRVLLKSAEDALAITALLTAPSRKGTPQSCQLKFIVDEACAFAACDLEARAITIDCDVDADLAVIGDAQAVRQMLINLLAQASRNACSGAVVRIDVRTTNDTAELSIKLSGQECTSAAIDDDFPMILARTLCELSNAELRIGHTPEGVRSWSVQFIAATQNDLFSGRA
jgi:two-component system cell cycle sensor histidine kinase PleC